jgi:hypothetical protein
MTRATARADVRTRFDHVYTLMASPDYGVLVTAVTIDPPADSCIVRLTTPATADQKGTESVEVQPPFRIPAGSSNGVAIKVLTADPRPRYVTIEFEEVQP